MHPDQKNEMQAFHSALILEFVFYFFRQMVKDDPRKWTILHIVNLQSVLQFVL